MKKVIWDYIDDYYFCGYDEYEINIRAYDNHNFHLWVNNSSKDEEVIDKQFISYDVLQTSVFKIIGTKINFPTVDNLLQIRELS